jgi:hypothetical protein
VAVLERAGGRQSANRGGIDAVGPRHHVGLCLTDDEALNSLLALMGVILRGGQTSRRALWRASPQQADVVQRCRSRNASGDICAPMKELMVLAAGLPTIFQDREATRFTS